MPRYVAFLGGINLGKRRVKMDDLQALFVDAGLDAVSTFIASGNVVFETTKRSTVTLEKSLEEHLNARLGYPVPTFIRTEAEVLEILATQPFEHVEPGNTLTVILFKQTVPPPAGKVFATHPSSTDSFHVSGRELYWRTAAGISASTVWTLPQIRALKLPSSTMRNRNTLERLAEKFSFGSAPSA
jgi:uncharacterized protein (DUF1697 family)